jgi:hypothetical protein
MGIWWAVEIFLVCLHLTLFIVGLYKITAKTLLNFIIHGALRLFGLKVVYDFMVSLNAEIGSSSINKIDVTRSDGSTPPFEVVPLDDPWSGQEKL